MHARHDQRASARDTVVERRAPTQTVPPEPPTSASRARSCDAGAAPVPPAAAARRGARRQPSHRHHGDGLFDETGRLRCRYPSEMPRGRGRRRRRRRSCRRSASGAIPSEVLRVVREAVLLDPYAHSGWPPPAPSRHVSTRPRRDAVAGELVRLYGIDGTYDGTGAAAFLQPTSGRAPAASAAADPAGSVPTRRRLAGTSGRRAGPLLAVRGTPPSPWRSPPGASRGCRCGSSGRSRWTGATRSTAGALDGIDLDAAATATAARRRIDPEFIGPQPRSTTGVAKALARRRSTRWLDAEDQRDDATPASRSVSEADEDALARVRATSSPRSTSSRRRSTASASSCSASPTSARDRAPTADDRRPAPPVAPVCPMPLFGGTMRVDDCGSSTPSAARSTIPVTAVRHDRHARGRRPPRDDRALPPAAPARRARWLFRLVDPGHAVDADPATARARRSSTRSAGDAGGQPGRRLPAARPHRRGARVLRRRRARRSASWSTTPITGGVTWEPAPGRPLPPDAGPLTGSPPTHRLLGRIAAGVVQRRRRDPAPGEPPRGDERAVGAAAGDRHDAVDASTRSPPSARRPSPGSSAGRSPSCGPRCASTLPTTSTRCTSPTPAAPTARRGRLRRRSPTQRSRSGIGDLGRSDDGVLGFFVDDDYRAPAPRRQGGRVARRSTAAATAGTSACSAHAEAPATDAIAAPVPRAPRTRCRAARARRVRLTLLMLPAGQGAPHLGIVLPRKALALARRLGGPGAERLMPSLRVGPVLVDPAEIRLPLVAPARRATRRSPGDRPLTWQDDPILAATQAALLPRHAPRGPGGLDPGHAGAADRRRRLMARKMAQASRPGDEEDAGEEEGSAAKTAAEEDAARRGRGEEEGARRSRPRGRRRRRSRRRREAAPAKTRSARAGAARRPRRGRPRQAAAARRRQRGGRCRGSAGSAAAVERGRPTAGALPPVRGRHVRPAGAATRRWPGDARPAAARRQRGPSPIGDLNAGYRSARRSSGGARPTAGPRVTGRIRDLAVTPTASGRTRPAPRAASGTPTTPARRGRRSAAGPTAAGQPAATSTPRRAAACWSTFGAGAGARLRDGRHRRADAEHAATGALHAGRGGRAVVRSGRRTAAGRRQPVGAGHRLGAARGLWHLAHGPPPGGHAWPRRRRDAGPGARGHQRRAVPRHPTPVAGPPPARRVPAGPNRRGTGHARRAGPPTPHGHRRAVARRRCQRPHRLRRLQPTASPSATTSASPATGSTNLTPPAANVLGRMSFADPAGGPRCTCSAEVRRPGAPHLWLVRR